MADAVEARVRAIVEPWLERHGRAAVMVAVVEPSGDRFFSFGSVDPSAAPQVAPDASSLFEIGSVTKVFTALLLAQMTLHGEVELDDPVRDYLPSTLRLPEWAGRPISLRDLVTHRSGLPYLPSDMPVMRRQRGEVVPETENIGHPSGARYPIERLGAEAQLPAVLTRGEPRRQAAQ
ncbi:MAG TPA: serine hydrolase domain-containing protein [Polyangiales bacterium]|nr:serine hydrolase domain-containing protein [Polyangiales bacterium]